MSSSVESVQDPSECLVLYVPSSSKVFPHVKYQDLQVEGDFFFVFAEQVLYPPNPTLNSLPTHVRGLFGVKARLPSDLAASNTGEMNSMMMNIWKKRIDGPVALMRCLVPLDNKKNMLGTADMSTIEKDMTYEDYEGLIRLWKTRTAAFDFFDNGLGFSHYNRPLGQYLRPFPIPSPDEKWKHPNWAPKKQVNELCMRIGRKAIHVDASARDIGDKALHFTQIQKKFYTKIELIYTNENNFDEIEPTSYMAQNGPFNTKAESENAACIDFLSEYHDVYLIKSQPDLYNSTRVLLGEDTALDQTEQNETNQAATSSSSISTDVDVPEAIKRPTIEIWKANSTKSKIDLFGNGTLVKSLLRKGNGSPLGITCTLRVWISILSEGNDGIYSLNSSKFEELTVGGLHPHIPIATLASMCIGESAFFYLSSDIVQNPNLLKSFPDQHDQLEVMEESRSFMILAMCIPSDAQVKFSGLIPTISNAKTPIEERVRQCKDCHKDAVVLYNHKHYKLALDHYQLGLKELSSKNPLFIDRTTMLIQNIAWNDELKDFKTEYIRNRLGAAACCLYIEQWPHHNDSWKTGDNSVEEGLLACEAVLHLDAKHFLAQRRKILLLIKGNQFAKARKELAVAESFEEAKRKENKASLEEARTKLDQREKQHASDETQIAKKMFSM
jgi:hypothetical protein